MKMHESKCHIWDLIQKDLEHLDVLHIFRSRKPETCVQRCMGCEMAEHETEKKEKRNKCGKMFNRNIYKISMVFVLLVWIYVFIILFHFVLFHAFSCYFTVFYFILFYVMLFVCLSDTVSHVQFVLIVQRGVQSFSIKYLIDTIKDTNKLHMGRALEGHGGERRNESKIWSHLKIWCDNMWQCKSV